jgi:hypothetical protein
MTSMRAPCLMLVLCASGCGSEPATCDSPVEIVAVDRATADDVTPILERSCSLGGCHLGAPGAGGLVLGRSTAEWRAATVNVRSHQNAAMALVTPGDPDRSWLVVKILGASCSAFCERSLGCGGPMPPGAPLTGPERATIIAWIADGAR